MRISKEDLDKIRTKKEFDGREYSAYNTTLKHLDEIGEYKVVHHGSFEVAEIPLVTFEYCLCSGAILFHENKNGISHTKYGFYEKPMGTIKQLRKQLWVKFNELQAVVVGSEYFEKILKYLLKKDVQVVGRYKEVDYYIEDKLLNFFSDKERDYDITKEMYFNPCPFDVISIPSTREVFIYTHKGRKDFKF